ncbi:ABC transporter ATP-binding protein [Agromyces luteolus]|uniref:ATP-binding cassette domain-containing protein n=1 Tax=Agromyces luteolus TaxID=88373 RepID=A0A7C9LC89_9MICO|nr:ABC transporter ATP-binding protein [Agromyces luteolus]MUN05751.1 ATP-binding cassette domain-containing protein [Agromyces luteolus]GLK26297.1 ABC transporter ATP-binding protein [Agromyces luteolus]
MTTSPAPGAPPVLSAQALTKTYGSGQSRFEALRGVSLDVRRGESLAIVGKSGSGKSTLMHLLALLDRPTAGAVEIDGEDAASAPVKRINRLRNERFGFVFQQFFLTAQQSVLENVTLPLLVAGVAPRERTHRGMAVLESLGLADKAKNKANDLSGGQKQRVVIARALINEPDVIFADEPTGNLDTATGGQVEDLLFGLQRERGITLVVVTHDDDLAARCDRRVTIADGLIVEGAGR